MAAVSGHPAMVGGMEHAALVALCITGLIASMQEMMKGKLREWVPRLAWVLPAVGFATLVIVPYFEVPTGTGRLATCFRRRFAG